MYKIILTWVGPADRLIIDGKFFRDSFLNPIEDLKYSMSEQGHLGDTIVDMSIPGKVIRTRLFDTEEHAVTCKNSQRPLIAYLDGAVGKRALFNYVNKYRITQTIDIVEIQ